MKVGLLTLAQKNEIAGQQFAPDCYFNPIQDVNDNWVISVEEIEQATVPPYDWVKDLPLIDFEPKQTEI
jgi:hypothetical protein